MSLIDIFQYFCLECKRIKIKRKLVDNYFKMCLMVLLSLSSTVTSAWKCLRKRQ